MNISNSITLHFRWSSFHPSSQFLIHAPFCPDHFLKPSKSSLSFMNFQSPKAGYGTTTIIHQDFHTPWTIITKNTFPSHKTKMKKSHKVVPSSMIGLQDATKREGSRFSRQYTDSNHSHILHQINLNYLARNSCRNMVRFWVNLSLFFESKLRITSAISLSKHRESRWCWSIGCKWTNPSYMT